MQELLSALEKAVLDAIIERSGATRELLREQVRLAEVSSREMTGVGFYTNLRLPSDAPRLAGRANLELNEIEADICGLKHGAGFILFVRDGFMQFLEGYTYDEQWPDKTASFSLKAVEPNAPRG